MIGQILTPARRQPRRTIDRLVVHRERWRFRPADLAFAKRRDPCERFLELRRWARRHGMPRFCFFKLSSEKKPCYVDFHSPIYVNLLAGMLQGGGDSAEGSLVVTEMLPRIDQAWLRDGEGNRYACELRLAAVDQGAAPTHGMGAAA